MSLIKKLIQRLLDSRTTPSEASHSSYPDDGTVIQYSPSATSVSSWTKVVDSTIAPSDGYVIVRGKATGESYVQITAGDTPPHMERSTFAKTTLNQYPILNLPIAKGKTFKVFAENTAEITVGLIKSIGGGYNRFVRRALPCLRALSNFSPKVSSRTSLNGLAVNPIHQQGFSYRLTQEAMCRRVTDTSAFTSPLPQTTQLTCILRRAAALCQGFYSSYLPIHHSLFQTLSRLKKESLSLSVVKNSLSFGSVRQSVQTNLRTGGVLC